MSNSAEPGQTAPEDTVCSGSTLICHCVCILEMHYCIAKIFRMALIIIIYAPVFRIFTVFLFFQHIATLAVPTTGLLTDIVIL